MITLIVLVLFALVLIGGFCVFLCLEAYASADENDDFHTLSFYIKHARRRTGLIGSFVLTLIILLPAFWLWGHLVMEWW